MYHDILLEKSEAENINKIAKILVMEDDIKRSQLYIQLLHEERNTISKYSDYNANLSQDLKYELSYAKYIADLYEAESLVWNRKYKYVESLLHEKEEEFTKYKNRYSEYESRLKQKDEDIYYFQSRIKELKDEFDKKLSSYESDLKNHQLKYNNLVDRYDILKEQNNNYHRENNHLRILANGTSNLTEDSAVETKELRKLTGNLKFMNETTKYDDKLYEYYLLLNKLTEILNFSDRDYKFLLTKSEVPNFLENYITDKIKSFVREFDIVNKTEIENKKLKSEIDQLKEVFSSTTQQMGAEITKLKLMLDEFREKDTFHETFNNYEKENKHLNDQLREYSIKIFSLKQSLNRYKNMNNSITKNGDKRSATPIVSRDFEQQLQTINHFKNTLPQVKNNVLESTLPQLKELTNYAKKTTNYDTVVSSIIERARTEKILGKYSKKY
eukprot:Mrub_03030.p1 GENE.Mrub_03030~~Mrub_03030.p1  ORF type:complete len:505 (+),score=106.69 Mrub_03030:192-1517(+)